jgi:hypothetical protein
MTLDSCVKVGFYRAAWQWPTIQECVGCPRSERWERGRPGPNLIGPGWRSIQHFMHCPTFICLLEKYKTLLSRLKRYIFSKVAIHIIYIWVHVSIACLWASSKTQLTIFFSHVAWPYKIVICEVLSFSPIGKFNHFLCYLCIL